MIGLRTLADWKNAALPAVAAALLAGCVSPGLRPYIPERNLPGPVAAPEAPEASAPPGTVIVRRGDSLYGIARDRGVALRALIDANRLQPPYLIHPGQRLMLPRARYHTVAAEETIYGIAQRYDIDMGELVRINGIPPPYKISRGQRLRLPDRPHAPRQVATVAPVPAALPPRAGSPPPAVVPAPPPPRAAPVARPPRRAGQRFLWPIRGRVILGFGRRGGGLHNDGINIAAREGSAIRAAENGVVAYAGNQLQGFGNLILLKHADGWMTAYAHNSVLLVRRGQIVHRGQIIARAGSTGNVTRPQLHFELRKGDQAVDPTRYLTRMARVRGGGVFAVRPERNGWRCLGPRASLSGLACDRG